MKRLPLLLLALVPVLLVSCMTADAGLLVHQDDGSDISAIAVKTQDGLQVMVGIEEYSSAEAEFALSFASADGKNHAVDENSICFYGGNYEKGEWTLIDSWNSNMYLQILENERRAALWATRIIGTLAIIDAIVDPDDFSFYYGYPYYSYSIRTSNPLVNLTFTALSVIETSVAIDQLTEISQAAAEQSVFKSAIVTPEQSASGIVCFRNPKTYPDYRLVYRNGGKDMEFTFSRTDRQELANPWADKSRGQVALSYAYTFGADRHNFRLDYLDPKGLGFFAGASLLSEANEKAQGTLGIDGGFNYKLSPYFWLYSGLEVGLDEDWRNPVFLGQAGMTISVNHMFFRGGALFNFNTISWMGEAGVGLSF